MQRPATEVVDCDLLIVGGGMAGCGAAWEAAREAKGLRTVLVEKSAIARSGAVGMGLASINCYIGTRWGENTPEDFVRYVRDDLMGLSRDDLVYDIARSVDAAVHLFEDWGLKFHKTEDGRYRRDGRWQVLIDGRSLKPIVAEAARQAIGKDNVYERVFISHLIKDARDGDRIAGAVGFGLNEPRIYVFRARAVICAAGGATNVWRPHRLREGIGRFWYSAFNSGSVYRLMLEAGAEMTQMEHRLVQTRFKDGYGPVGMWSLHAKAAVENRDGERPEDTYGDELDNWRPYADARPVPTPVRNYQMMRDIFAGRGPFTMKTDRAFQSLYRNQSPERIAELEDEAFEDFLDHTTKAQALAWASQDIDPSEPPAEVYLSEPYLLGSHAAACGAWVSGPEDIAPEAYRWGYNRMTTVAGLFAAGDGVGGAAHKFSSGSFAEGGLAAKAAVAYAADMGDEPRVDEAEIERIKAEIWAPFEVFEAGRGASSREEVNPTYLLPKMGLLRLQKLMDEYAAGPHAYYRTNDPMLKRGLELVGLLEEDLERLAARDLRELLRCWELRDRTRCAECHLQHVLYRKETRWPGYLYRPDYDRLDDENWKLFVNSRYDARTGGWQMSTKPVIQVID
ncbi:MAG: adenylyl-sulfate reductase subunit alpha [Kiloniellales bacterium]